MDGEDYFGQGKHGPGVILGDEYNQEDTKTASKLRSILMLYRKILLAETIYTMKYYFYLPPMKNRTRL